MQETPFLDQPAQLAVRFSDAERQLLLLTPGVGPMVLERMEDVGINSVEQLRCEGVEAVVDLVCRRVGSTAWANRKGALGGQPGRLSSRRCGNNSAARCE